MTPYTNPPILPKSKTGLELLGLNDRTASIKEKGSRYYHDEHLMKNDKVREYHQAEQAFEREDYEEAARICYEIVDINPEPTCSEGILARANMLLARPELLDDAVSREYYASEAIYLWTKIILHHEEGHLSDTVTFPQDKVYSKYPVDLAKHYRKEAQELFDDALTDGNMSDSTVTDENKADQSAPDEDTADEYTTDQDQQAESSSDPPLRTDTPMGSYKVS